MSQSIADFLRLGPATSRQIQSETGMSQATVARFLRKLGDSVVKIPNGRSPKYALTNNAFGADDELPLFMVDTYGNNSLVAIIRPLASGGFYVQQATGMPSVLLGVNENGLYEDLPYFLYDLRPQGFLGRQIAEEMFANSDDFPNDPRRWSNNHIGRYLVSNGDDLPGNLKFGKQAHLRVRRTPEIVSESDYPKLAERVMNGIIPGSSAGGEQPKFTAYCGDRSAHVLVKFSPRGTHVLARRWRDILITEYHATEALHSMDNPVPAAETRLIDSDGRLFLESLRFDRNGEYGRMPMISLHAVDAEFTGLGANWPNVMGALHEKNLVSWQHVFDAESLWIFGKLINNTDMHLDNLSLAVDGSAFRLLPVYDMCSMGFAPEGGEVRPYEFNTPNIRYVNLDEQVLQPIVDAAYDFWQRVSNDERISDEFREFLRINPLNEHVEKQQLSLV